MQTSTFPSSFNRDNFWEEQAFIAPDICFYPHKEDKKNHMDNSTALFHNRNECSHIKTNIHIMSGLMDRKGQILFSYFLFLCVCPEAWQHDQSTLIFN